MQKIFEFRPTIIIFLIISTIILLIYSLGNDNAIEFIKYFSYLYSALSLIVVILNVKRFNLFLRDKITNNNVYIKVKNNLYKSKQIKRYFEDNRFKTLINLYLSSLINFLFIFKKLYEGITYKSIWFISFAIYYILLTLTKFFLLRRYNNSSNKKEEYKVYRSIGYFMMVLNLMLTIMIIQMISENVATIYPGNVIYLSALYSFILITTAIVNIIKYRKYNSPILSSVKAINLFTAFVSILMLQTTMIATFSGTEDFMKLMNTLTGTGIITIILFISTYMVVNGNKNMKEK